MMEKADRVYIRNMIESLSRISEICEQGVQRRSYTPEYRQGVDYVRKQMEEAGLTTEEDAAGNLFGTLAGRETLPAIYSGSHLDTVKCAGAYDGIAGVVCALEVGRMIRRSKKPLRHPYRVFGTVEEEGSRFGRVVLGSRMMTGSIDADQLRALRESETGESFSQVLETYRACESCFPKYEGSLLKEISGQSNGQLSSEISQDMVCAVVELHGEQGAVLEKEGYDIGVVDTIAGIAWLEVTVTGQAGHSGTVPMNYRNDAGAAACKWIAALYDYVHDRYSGKATLTAGTVTFDPDSPNCIPGKCVFSLDVRSGNKACLQDILEKVTDYSVLAKEMGCKTDIRQLSYRNPTDLSEEIRSQIESSARSRGFKSRRIDSGAGHDSMIFAEKWPTGMIFLPNRDGISHHPDEYIDPEALGRGTEVLYDTIRQLDEL